MEHYPHGFIVMPTAHGKSYLRVSYPFIHESDDLYDYRANPELVTLRHDAKFTGDWTAYDKMYGALIREELIKRVGTSRAVVLVPSYSLGQAADWTFIGVHRLTKKVWAGLCRKRGFGASKHYQCWKEAGDLGAEEWDDPDAMHQKVVTQAGKFIAGDYSYAL